MKKRSKKSAKKVKESIGHKDKPKMPLWKMATENIECLAVAIVMALILNTFFIQAYKIPTGSMQPTLIGNKEQGLFDRVLVNKNIYLFSEPERFDIIVFKYPLDQSKNYIKRLIGLPGEKIAIQGGDIYANGSIARKPEAATDAVLKRIFPDLNGGPPFGEYFETEGDCSVEGDTRVVFPGPGTVSTRHPVRDLYLDGYDPDYGISKPFHVVENKLVGDLRLAFEVRLDRDDGAVTAKILEEGKEHRLFLRGKNQPSPSRMSTGPALAAGGQGPKEVWTDPEIALEAGKTYSVVFSNIDDRLSIRLDGDEIAVWEYDGPSPEGASHTNRVEFGLEGCGGAFDGIALFRDIYYLADGVEPREFEVPPDHYFVLGDNTQNSADGRRWQAVVFQRKDGSEVIGNFNGSRETRPQLLGGTYAMVDRFGDERYIPRSELKESGFGYRPESFFPSRLLLGKAMVVFWPMVPHFRWKLLR